jgi:hypothetical protein
MTFFFNVNIYKALLRYSALRMEDDFLLYICEKIEDQSVK